MHNCKRLQKELGPKQILYFDSSMEIPLKTVYHTNLEVEGVLVQINHAVIMLSVMDYSDQDQVYCFPIVSTLVRLLHIVTMEAGQGQTALSPQVVLSRLSCVKITIQMTPSDPLMQACCVITNNDKTVPLCSYNTSNNSGCKYNLVIFT